MTSTMTVEQVIEIAKMMIEDQNKEIETLKRALKAQQELENDLRQKIRIAGFSAALGACASKREDDRIAKEMAEVDRVDRECLANYDARVLELISDLGRLNRDHSTATSAAQIARLDVAIAQTNQALRATQYARDAIAERIENRN